MTYGDIRVLQAVRLKGRPSGDDLAGAVGLSPEALEQVVSPLIEGGCVERARDRLKLTQHGRDRLAALVEADRQVADQDLLGEVYERFGPFNAEFKQVITDWQLIDGETPNDHSDSDHDDRVVQRLIDLHERFLPLLRDVVAIAPRLGHYPDRFAAAVRRILDGDRSWLARPLSDSYHTIWFELHEDLIELSGLSRTAEAAVGRAE